MRILNLQLRAYGCFTNVALEFGPDGQGFHLIYGDNEAGKSTALRALMGFFFGIPAQTPDSFLHENSQLRIGAELQKADGTRRAFIRRKGNKDTLLNADGKAIHDVEMVPYLGGVPQRIFETLFCISHDVLVRGGKELLSGRGDVAESLFQAGSGVTGLRKVLDGLQAEADRFFKPRSSTCLLSAAIAGYSQARKDCREASVLPRDWAKLAKELDDKTEQLHAVEDQLRQLRSEHERKQRFKLAVPHVSRRGDLIAERDGLGPIILLPETAAKEREDTEHRLENAKQRKQEAEAAIAGIERDLRSVNVPKDLLAQEESINRLHQRLTEYSNAIRDFPRVDAEREQFEDEAKGLIAEMKPGLSLDHAESLRLTVTQRSRIQTLACDYKTIEERLRASKEKAETTSRDLTENEEILGRYPKLPDPTTLEQAIEQVGQQGDLEARLGEERKRMQAQMQEASIDLQRLGLWSGSLTDIEGMPLPSAETVNRFEMELSDLSGEEKRLGHALEDARKRVSEQEKAIHALQLGGGVPTEDNLRAARERRDRGWKLIRGAWIDGIRDEEQVRQFDPSKQLPDAYEESVGEADGVGDRLRREADRVAQLAGLCAEEDAAKNLASTLEGQIQAVQKKSHAIVVDWEQIWQTAGIHPLTPREMRDWLSRQRELATQVGAIRDRRDSISELEQTIEQQAKELNEALVTVGAEPRKDGETLRSLLQRGRGRLKQIQDQAKKRVDLAADVRRLTKGNNKALTEQKDAEQQLTEWRDQWTDALSPLRFNSDLVATDALIVLEKVQKLFGSISNMKDRDKRVHDMQTVIDHFGAAISSLTTSVAKDLHGLPSDQVAAALNSRLKAAQQLRTRSSELSKQFEDEKGKLAKCGGEIDSATEKLSQLMNQANCGDLASLRRAEESSSRKRTIDNELEQLNKMLAEYAAGVSVAAFVEEICKENADQLPMELQGIAEQIKELETQRDAFLQEKTTLQNSLKAMDGSDTAAATAEQAQSNLAQVRSGSERYMQLRLACEILRRCMDKFREQNQGPIITEAGNTFPRLTHASFSGLSVGFDDKDNQILLGVRPSGQEVSVEGMSDGTLDQLYLALRLASLKAHLKGTEPLPFIVDDILINFDDGRASMALEALADLSKTTQVLFFTHHSRLQELAKKVIAADQLRTHLLTRN